jgi:hypothetical protein
LLNGGKREARYSGRQQDGEEDDQEVEYDGNKCRIAGLLFLVGAAQFLMLVTVAEPLAKVRLGKYLPQIGFLAKEPMNRTIDTLRLSGIVDLQSVKHLAISNRDCRLTQTSNY